MHSWGHRLTDWIANYRVPFFHVLALLKLVMVGELHLHLLEHELR